MTLRLPSFPQALILVGIGVVAYLSFTGVGAPGYWPDGMTVGCVVVAGLAMVVRGK
jgi:hypothetical protein